MSTSSILHSILIPYCRVLWAQFQFPFSYCQNLKFAIFVSRIDCNCSHSFVKVFINQTFFLYMPKNVNMMYTVKIEIQNNYSTSCLLPVYFQSTSSLLQFQSTSSLLPVYFQSTSSLLTVYLQSSFSLLPVYFQSTSSLLSVHFQSTSSLLPVYFQSTSSLLPVYF